MVGRAGAKVNPGEACWGLTGVTRIPPAWHRSRLHVRTMLGNRKVGSATSEIIATHLTPRVRCDPGTPRLDPLLMPDSLPEFVFLN